MSSSSKIEWTDATWNPVSGCSKVSQGCKNCYAERLWPKVAGAEAKRTGQPARAFTDVRCHPERLDAPIHWRQPRRIFVNSMSDLFHEDVPDQFIDEVWGTMIEAPQHQYQILTKRPARMRAYVNNYGWRDDARITKWPLPQVWLGVSVEDQETAQARVPDLWSTRAAVRFISYEPALGPMAVSVVAIPKADVIVNQASHDIHPGAMDLARDGHDVCLYDLGGIDWVIAGGESGPGARPPRPEWFRWCRDDCKSGGIHFFFKQWGEWAPVTPGPTALKARRTYLFEEMGQCSATLMARVGKKAAGRHLDGHIHHDYPK